MLPAGASFRHRARDSVRSSCSRKGGSSMGCAHSRGNRAKNSRLRTPRPSTRRRIYPDGPGFPWDGATTRALRRGSARLENAVRLSSSPVPERKTSDAHGPGQHARTDHPAASPSTCAPSILSPRAIVAIRLIITSESVRSTTPASEQTVPKVRDSVRVSIAEGRGVPWGRRGPLALPKALAMQIECGAIKAPPAGPTAARMYRPWRWPVASRRARRPRPGPRSAVWRWSAPGGRSRPGRAGSAPGRGRR